MATMVRNLISGLSGRERRLMALVGLVAVMMVVFLAIFFVRSAISDLERETDTNRQTLRQIAARKADYLARLRDIDRHKNKGNTKPTPLRTLVDKVGRQLDVTIPDIKELPDQQHGTGWVEHAAELSMREVGLAALTEFMEEVESNRRKFPIAITKLDVRKRRRSNDLFDIKMIISTYERVAATEGAESGKKSSPGKGRKGAR